MKPPFFFLIDFEGQKPLVLPLEEAATCGVFFDILGQRNFKPPASLSLPALQLSPKPLPFSRYEAAFQQVQNQLQQGNTYLLNLSLPTPIDCNYSLEQLFYASRAPYKLWLQDQFVCFSPECFVTMAQDQIKTYPMKGTIDAALDHAEQQLLASPKEQWEHHTIVDLMRNDLAMVAQEIEVSRFRYVEKIETERGAILQTSSEIRGKLPAHWRDDPLALLQKLLPAGSISGAPKARTVEIIRHAEQQPRGYYTGVFGIFDGETLISAVAIRYIEKTPQGLQFRSGGGITAQSRGLDEYDEILQKIYVPLAKGNP